MVGGVKGWRGRWGVKRRRRGRLMKDFALVDGRGDFRQSENISRLQLRRRSV